MEKRLKNGRGAAAKKKIVAEKCNKKKIRGYFRIRVALFDLKKKKKKRIALRVLTLRKLRQSSFFFWPKETQTMKQ